MENKTIEVLEKLISLKDETIKELERQIQLLKNQPPISFPQAPAQPYTPATNPYTQPVNPQWPWTQPWYTITSVSGNPAITLTGDPLPLGSIQYGPSATHTFTNTNGSTNIIDINKIARA